MDAVYFWLHLDRHQFESGSQLWATWWLCGEKAFACSSHLQPALRKHQWIRSPVSARQHSRPRLRTDQTRNSRVQEKSVFLIIGVNDDLRFLSDVIKIPRVTRRDNTESPWKRSLESHCHTPGVSVLTRQGLRQHLHRDVATTSDRMKRYFICYLSFAGAYLNIHRWTLTETVNDARCKQVTGFQLNPRVPPAPSALIKNRQRVTHDLFVGGKKTNWHQRF